MGGDLMIGIFRLNCYSQVTLTESNLPILKITTPLGQQINDINRIVCDLGIIDNGPGNLNQIIDAAKDYLEIKGVKDACAFSLYSTQLEAKLLAPLLQTYSISSKRLNYIFQF